MTQPKKKTNVPKGGADTFLGRITDRVKMYTALVVAIGALATALTSQYDNLRIWIKGWYTPPPCLLIDSPIFPETVKLSEWDSTKVTLHGHQNCQSAVGLYMTFWPRTSNGQLFTIEPPRESFKECRDLGANLYPECWEYQKPIVSKNGEWSWNVRLPRLHRVSDPSSEDKIFISWSVRDYDDPNKPAMMAGSSAVITVLNDMGNRGVR